MAYSHNKHWKADCSQNRLEIFLFHYSCCPIIERPITTVVTIAITISVGAIVAVLTVIPTIIVTSTTIIMQNKAVILNIVTD